MQLLQTSLASSLFILCIFANAQDMNSLDLGSSSSSNNQNYSTSSNGSSGVGIVVGENYILKPSDVISVEVYQEADLEKSVRVEGDGSVALALIGKVKVAGMTVAEAQSLITDLYNRDYMLTPKSHF